ncbi:MAG: hypothetical protein LBN41_03895 [Enterobacteriaceae bacterium]|nr:hypothetical protein [Enterobacteriaceae bacterium]
MSKNCSSLTLSTESDKKLAISELNTQKNRFVKAVNSTSDRSFTQLSKKSVDNMV